MVLYFIIFMFNKRSYCLSYGGESLDSHSLQSLEYLQHWNWAQDCFMTNIIEEMQPVCTCLLFLQFYFIAYAPVLFWMSTNFHALDNLIIVPLGLCCWFPSAFKSSDGTCIHTLSNQLAFFIAIASMTSVKLIKGLSSKATLCTVAILRSVEFRSLLSYPSIVRHLVL